MEHIFNNLLTNAIKFTPRDGKVKLVLKQIRQPREGVRFSVRDTGVGINKEDIEKIFDRFYQVDGSSSRENEGTGIGLSLVKELVELHGGTIDVKSEPGFGTEFSVFIPGNVSNEAGKQCCTEGNTVTAELAMLETGAIENVAKDTGSISAVGNDGKDKATVLIVDDNTDIRNYLYSCLISAFNILQVGDGAEGLQLAQQHQPDLIISDIMMPGVDGYQLCRAIKGR